MADNSPTLVRATYAFAVAGILTLIILITASFWLLEKTRVSTEDVLRTREQRSALTRLLSIVQDTETGQRGYLLTGEQRYLEPYEAARKGVQARLVEAQAAFQNDPEARSALTQIQGLVAAKLQELAETVQLKKDGKSSDALAVVMTDRGKRLMDSIRTLMGQQSEIVEAKLGRSVDEQRQNTNLARQVTLGAGLIILLAAMGGVATILKYTRELLAARTEVEQLNVGLENRVNERTADLQRANEEIQRFAYIVSHDLRAPLVNVMGYTSELESSLQTLQSLADDPQIETLASGVQAREAIATDLPESIGFIRNSTRKMDGLIKAILKLSREGQRVLTPELISLNEFFNSIAGGVQHRLSETGGEIRIVKPLATIESDRLALEQIFGNLVDNALKYMPKGRAAQITIRQNSSRWGSVVIEVEDNGRGIGVDDQERVFDLFRRAGPQDQQGEGIGLAHVRTLVRRLGGEITMTSDLGRGTTFRVMLPNKLKQLTEQANER